MRRRYFLVASIIATGAAFTNLTKKINSKISNTDNSVTIEDTGETIFLKRNQVINLPEKPESIDTIIHFNISTYRFGKSPILKPSGKKINGQDYLEFNVKKNIKNIKSYDFYLQYTGEDIGWIVLT